MSEQRWPRAWQAATPGTVCPQCGEAAGRPIVWGMPIPAVLDAIDSGEIDVELGGCVVPDEPVTHQCRACSATFTPPTRHGRRTSAR